MAELSLTRLAEDDLDSILDYSIRNFGPDVADRYRDDLEAALFRLRDYPELGMVIEELRGQERCLPCREHRIYYRFEGDIVHVTRILHHAMDAKRWLE